MAITVVQLNDNTTAGAEVVVDRIGGQDYQVVKKALGAAGTANLESVGAGAVDTGTPRVTLASDDPAVAVLGATSGSAVTTDANGTIQQYLRGVISKFISGIVVFGAAAENAAVAGNPNLVGGRYDSSPRTITSGRAAAIALDENGRVQVVGDTNLAAAATGGYTPGYHITENNINAEVIKASAGTLGFLVGINLTADILFLKLYDKATAPDPSADSALLKQIYPIPANTSGAGIALPIPPQGLDFADGIAFAITDALSPTDETAVAANAGVISYGYA